MVHDRRIDGETSVFGNAGSLYKNAMTLWDHNSQSVWSQPSGQALEGELAGVKLFLLPSEVTSWSNWVSKQPRTQLMTTGLRGLGGRAQTFDPDFVIGLVLGDDARAYYYEDIAAAGVINDQLGQTPVVLWAEGEQTAVYSRLHEEKTLNFSIEDGLLVDEQTGSRWDPARGLAVSGPLAGTALRQIPSLTSFDWAWPDFYPQSGFYEHGG